ncbi:hypothetical protein HCJ66_11460 [Listeria sp. FSL L7-1582]|uniref:hypothetical protein n=1 Tax=Listeria portnoyi TaxID=2713504 RepID=UPI00164ED675|nr:hypothetical protein [Listeria portnoyi]MBC6310155.1 hypothetical protein [Listeria portnoyi]
MKPLKKWKDSLYSSENLDITNKNVDTLNQFFVSDQEQKEVLRKRIANLILNTGNDGNNEVIDARVSSLQNKTFDTLEERINSDIDYLSDTLSIVLSNVTDTQAIVQEVNDKLKKLYGLDSGTIEVYVNAVKGNDSAGDGSFEAPYRTIMRAFQDIPHVLDGNDAYIFCASGSYNEAVEFPRISGGRVFLQALNYETIDTTTLTGCKVYSIVAKGLPYVEINGFEQLDAYTNYPTNFIRIDSCQSANLRRVRFATNFRNQTDHFALIVHGSTMVWCYECRWAYQNVDIRSQYGSNVIVNEDCTHGGKSVIGLVGQMAKIYNRRSNKLAWEADTATQTYPGGEFITPN